MNTFGAAIAVVTCSIAIAVSLALMFIVLLLLWRIGNRPDRCVTTVLHPHQAWGNSVRRELAVDPTDAARTDQLLRELIAASGLEDWDTDVVGEG